jgi:hypothetical protein
MADIENLNVYYGNYGALVRHLVIEVETDKIINLKISDVLVISLEDRRVLLRGSETTVINESSYDPEGYSIERFCSFSKNIPSDRLIIHLSKVVTLNSPNTELHDRSCQSQKMQLKNLLSTKRAI